MKTVEDPGYRAARFLATLKAHGMQSQHQARFSQAHGSSVLQQFVLDRQKRESKNQV